MPFDISSLLEQFVKNNVISNEEKPQVLKIFSELNQKLGDSDVYKTIKQYSNPNMQKMYENMGLPSIEAGALLSFAIFTTKLESAQKYFTSLQQSTNVYFPTMDFRGKICDSCGSVNTLAADYCVKCGKQLKS